MRRARCFFRRSLGILAGFALALASQSAFADGPENETAAPAPTIAKPAPLPLEPPSTTRELRYSLPIDGAVTAVAAGGFLFLKLDQNNLTPSTCGWCDTSGAGTDSLDGFDHAFRNAFLRNDTTPAATANDIIAFGVAPISALGLLTLAGYRDDGNLHNAPIDMMLVAEATFLSLDLNEAVKYGVAREQPAFHFASTAAHVAGGSSGTRISFYSEHTSTAFALAVSAVTIAEMRGYSIAPLVWGSGLILATTTGYLGVAADKEYMSDALVGAAAGSLIGFVVPYLFHRPIAQRVRISFSPEKNGALVNAVGAW